MAKRIIDIWWDKTYERMLNAEGKEISSENYPHILYKEQPLARIRIVEGSIDNPCTDYSDESIMSCIIDNDFTDGTSPFVQADYSAFNVAGDWEVDSAHPTGQADITNGEISIRLNGFDSNFLSRIGALSKLENTLLEILEEEAGTADVLSAVRIPFYVWNLMNKTGTTPPSPMEQYLTLTNARALMGDGREIEFSVDGSTSWHSTQTDLDDYWRERYPAGEWSVAIKLPDGAQGISIRLKGAWDNATEYVNNSSYIDVVSHNGSSYGCLVTNTGFDPEDSASATKWELLAEKGDTGATGVSIRMAGDWDVDTEYVNSSSYVDIVSYQGSSYACLETNTGVEPDSSSGVTCWQLVAEKGDTGTDANPIAITPNTQTDSYTLVLTDAGKNIRMNKGTANTLTIPTNASVAFPVNTIIVGMQVGAGATSVSATAGVTLNDVDGGITGIQYQYGAFMLIKVGTDAWEIAGAIAGVA